MTALNRFCPQYVPLICSAAWESCLDLGPWGAPREGGQIWDVAGIRYDGGASHLSPVKMQGSSGHAQSCYRC